MGICRKRLQGTNLGVLSAQLGLRTYSSNLVRVELRVAVDPSVRIWLRVWVGCRKEVTWVVVFKVILKRVPVTFVVLGMSHMR